MDRKRAVVAKLDMIGVWCMIDLCGSLGKLFSKTRPEEKPVEGNTSILITKEPFSSQERKLW
jgi:hypothetical protein